MRYRTLEIFWHGSQPISSCDFQHIPLKRARPATSEGYAAQAYKLATGGDDNNVRVWMVYPSIVPPGPSATAGRAPRVEYLATLSRHSAGVNVVRFSPNGELIASAGDDGMVIIWAQSSSSSTASYGNEQEDMQYEKEHWKPRTTFQCGTMQVYDLAWSPTGEYIVTGSTDNTARVYTIPDGKCVHEIAEHSHFVQGVAWDPMNEYIATQSSDRSMHVYKISTKNGIFEAHAVGKNSRMSHQHSRTPSVSRHGRSTTPSIASGSRSRAVRSESVVSDTESIMTTTSEQVEALSAANATPLTPATSVSSQNSMFPPPAIEKPSSRRSSFSGSQAPSSPATFNRYGRSPSPMPALPAIRTPPANAWTTAKLYGDESFTNFFRRLTFSTDGGLLLTPAGQFEDPSVTVKKAEDVPARGRKTRPVITTDSAGTAGTSTSSVYIYSRANFARPPIAQLPGHKKASVAVKFSPVLYELRQGVVGAAETQRGVIEKGHPGEMNVDLVSTTSAQTSNIVAPSPKHAGSESSMLLPPNTLHASKPSTPVPTSSMTTTTGSVFALPYRMLYAVLTMDTVAIYDTQQSGPVCLLTKLHYDEFTDLSWSPDGQCLILSSRDGYCTLIIFDDILPAHHTQQHSLQLQTLAQHTSQQPFSTPMTNPSVSLPVTPSHTHVVPPTTLPVNFMPPLATLLPKKRSESGGDLEASGSGVKEDAEKEKEAKEKEKEEPPKKKRRVQLTRVE